MVGVGGCGCEDGEGGGGCEDGGCGGGDKEEGVCQEESTGREEAIELSDDDDDDEL
jgi:hypothetical protein